MARGRSVLLGSMLRPPRHRRWPHRGRSLLLANPPQAGTCGAGQQMGLRASDPEKIVNDVPLEAVCADPVAAALVSPILIKDSCPAETAKVAGVD
jgi:hypothetical protein